MKTFCLAILLAVVVAADHDDDHDDDHPAPPCTSHRSRDLCDKKGCSWCESSAVPAACYSMYDAKVLPSSIFTCDGLGEATLASMAVVAATTAAPAFNLTTCPRFDEVQHPRVAANFSLNRFMGTYYDYTQYPVCPKPDCVRSIKSFVPGVGSGRDQILDNFTIGCFGLPSRVHYYFNVTADTGALVGFIAPPVPVWWKALGFAATYNNTIVDFAEDPDDPDGQLDWVIEFQCRENGDGKKVQFTGINFYSKHQQMSQAHYDAMLQAARDRGLGVYMDAGFGTRTVPQQNCTF